MEGLRRKTAEGIDGRASVPDPVFENCPKSLRRLILDRVLGEPIGDPIVPIQDSLTVGVIVFGNSVCVRYINPYAQLLLQDHGNRSRVNETNIGMDIATLVAQLKAHASGEMVSRIAGPWNGLNSPRTGQANFRMRAMTLPTWRGTIQAPVLVLIEPCRDPNPPARSADSYFSRAASRISQEPRI